MIFIVSLTLGFSLANAVDVDRRTILRGISGLAVSPVAKGIPIAPLLTTPVVIIQTAVAKTLMTPTPLTFPTSVEEMALLWRWGHAKETYFSEYVQFAAPGLIRYLQDNPQTAAPVKRELEAYLEHFSLENIITLYEHQGPFGFRVGEMELKNLSVAVQNAGIIVPSTFGESFFGSEILAMEDEMTRAFGISSTDFLKAQGIFQNSARLYFLETEPEAKQIALTPDFYRALFTRMHKISPLLASELAMTPSLMNNRGVLMRQLGLTDRNAKSNLIEFQMNLDPDETEWFLLKEGETVKDRAKLYLEKIAKLERLQKLVELTPESPPRAAALRVLHDIHKKINLELSTLDERLAYARDKWNNRPADPGLNGHDAMIFGPSFKRTFNPAWLSELRQLSSELSLPLPASLEVQEIASLPADVCQAQLEEEKPRLLETSATLPMEKLKEETVHVEL